MHTFLLVGLLLVVPRLRCCAQAFPSCGERRLLLAVVGGLLTAVASLVAGHRLEGAWPQSLQPVGSRALSQ